MDAGSAFLEILFFGMVAAFLVIRLRSVLGRRMVHERDPQAKGDRSGPTERAKGKAEMIIAKQRHGPTGTVELAFEGQFTRFSDLAEEDRLPERFE